MLGIGLRECLFVSLLHAGTQTEPGSHQMLVSLRHSLISLAVKNNEHNSSALPRVHASAATDLVRIDDDADD